MTINKEKRNIPNPRDLSKRFHSQETALQSLALHEWQSIRKDANVRYASTPTDIFFAQQEEVYSVCNARTDTT